MRQNRTNLVFGLLLILVGAWLILKRQVPAIQLWLDKNFAWPMWTILSRSAYRISTSNS